MKSVLAAAAMSLVISDFANAEETRGKAMMEIEPSAISEADIRAVSPALARFGREAITEDLWTREALSPRDRSVVTVAMLIARNQPAELKHYLDVALDSGVTPAELSEIITHLAFYSGWPNAMSAVGVTKAVLNLAASRQMHFLKLLRTCFPSIRKQRSSVQRRWKKTWAQSLQAWLNSLPIHSSWISGKDPR